MPLFIDPVPDSRNRSATCLTSPKRRAALSIDQTPRPPTNSAFPPPSNGVGLLFEKETLEQNSGAVITAGGAAMQINSSWRKNRSFWRTLRQKFRPPGQKKAAAHDFRPSRAWRKSARGDRARRGRRAVDHPEEQHDRHRRHCRPRNPGQPRQPDRRGRRGAGRRLVRPRRRAVGRLDRRARGGRAARRRQERYGGKGVQEGGRSGQRRDFRRHRAAWRPRTSRASTRR